VGCQHYQAPIGLRSEQLYERGDGMPYFNDPNLDQENQNKTQGQGGSDGSSVSISGASPSVNSNASGQTQGSGGGGSKGLNTGSGFTNLDNYIQNNNSQDFGNKFLGKVSDQVQGAQTQMNQAADDFKNQVKNSNQLATTDQLNSAIANPTSADPTQFQTWENQSYTGPKSLGEDQDSWNKYWSGAQQAQTNTQLLGSDSGRFSLLNQYFGRPSYNNGEQSLDNLLFQQSGLGDQTKALQDQATQLQTVGNQKAQELQGIASQQAGAVEQNRNQVRAAIGLDAQGNVITGDGAGAIGKEYASADAALAQQNAQRQINAAKVKNDAASNMFTPQELNDLGLTQGQNIYGLDLSKYVNQGSALTKDQALNSDQRARIQALSQLAGITDTYASGTPQDITSPYSFDKSSFSNDLQAQKGAYDKAMQQTPISIPAHLLMSGEGGGPVPISELEQRVAATQALLSSGSNVPGGQQFINEVAPLIAQAKANIAKQFQTDRTIGVSQYTPLNIGKNPSVYGSIPEAPYTPPPLLAGKPSVFGRIPGQ
jgi:hypothetical protein